MNMPSNKGNVCQPLSVVLPAEQKGSRSSRWTPGAPPGPCYLSLRSFQTLDAAPPAVDKMMDFGQEQKK